MEEVLKLLQSPNLAGSAAAVVMLLIVAVVQVRKLYRNDQGEQTVDMTYRGILEVIRKQEAECQEGRKRDREECDKRLDALAERIQVLEMGAVDP